MEVSYLAHHPGPGTGQHLPPETWLRESRGSHEYTGTTVFRGGPGSFMFVPAGCPLAFVNPGPEPARMLFRVSPAGHEIYLRELTDQLAAGGPPNQAEISVLRRRHDIHQLTPLTSHPLRQ
jgi:hypothetical protein